MLLISHISTLIESINDALVQHIEDNNVSKSRHGFVGGKSYLTNLLIFVKDINKAMYGSIPADVF